MAGSRSALIVATYVHDDQALTRLQAPAKDADALAAILSDPDIGGFDVGTVVNGKEHEITLAVAKFFHDRRPDDLLLLHFSCHGLKDDSGELYFAASDTRLDLLEATGVASSFVSKAMDRTRAGRVLLLLDCCYAGAFARTSSHRASGAVDVADRLGGRGRVVITASSALQYAFEGQELATDEASPSVFTGALVRGLRTGEADRDQDGWVSLDELYAYVYDEVTRLNPLQTPKKWAFDIEGDVYVARRSGPVTVPSELPALVRESMASLVTWEREAAVSPLRDLLLGHHPGRALAARLALEDMAAHDDSDKVKMAAAAALSALPPAEEKPEAETQPEEDDPASPPPASPPVEPTATEPMGPVSDVVTSAPPVAATPPRVGAPRRLRRWSVLAAAGLAVVLGGALVVKLWPGGGGTTEAVLATSEFVVPGADGLQVYEEADPTRPRTIPNTGSARLPSISPSRDLIAYVQAVSGQTDSQGNPLGHLRLVRPDGTDDQPLVSATDDACPYATWADWSPDGSELAVRCLDDQGSLLGLFVVGLQSRTLVQVVTPEAAVAAMGAGAVLTGRPTWRDDNELIFTITLGNQSRLWKAPAQHDATPRQVLRSPGSDWSPAWSPAGLMFLHSVNGTTEVVRQTSSGPEPLITDLASVGRLVAPTWSPDGDQLMWTIWSTTGTTVHIAEVSDVPVTADGGESIALTAPSVKPDW